MDTPVLTSLICPHCGGTIPASRGSKARYCADRCRTAAWARKEKRENPDRVRARGRKWHHINREKSIAASRLWKENNRFKNAARHKEWCRANADKCREYCRKAYYADPQKNIAAAVAWARANPERRAEYRKRHYEENIGDYLARAKLRKAKVRRATPKWLTRDDHQLMADIYDTAVGVRKKFGPIIQVDHIIPLQGKTVCGLHVPWNLQIMAAKQNRAKSNKLLEAA